MDNLVGRGGPNLNPLSRGAYILLRVRNLGQGILAWMRRWVVMSLRPSPETYYEVESDTLLLWAVY